MRQPKTTVRKRLEVEQEHSVTFCPCMYGSSLVIVSGVEKETPRTYNHPGVGF